MFVAPSRADLSSFPARVIAVVRRIPSGRVATYGDVALWAGAPRAARAVGTVMRQCRDPYTPCHRVVGAGGVLGGWGGPLAFKRDRLRAEGIVVDLVRVQRFADVRWQPRTRPGAAARAGRRTSSEAR